MDYIDIVGVRNIFVQQQQETVVVHLIGKWDCREEREARWEVVLRSYIQTECSPNYRRLFLNSLVGRLSVVLLLLVSVPPCESTLVCGHSVVYSSLI